MDTGSPRHEGQSRAGVKYLLADARTLSGNKVPDNSIFGIVALFQGINCFIDAGKI